MFNVLICLRVIPLVLLEIVYLYLHHFLHCIAKTFFHSGVSVVQQLKPRCKSLLYTL